MDVQMEGKNWVKAKVEDLAKLLRGITYKKEEVSKSPIENYKPVLRGNNINGSLNFDDLVYVPQKLITSEQIIKAGDIIFAMSSGSKHLVGKSAKARFDYDGSYGAFCALLRPSESINKDFLYYVFQSSNFRRLISEIAKGSNINNLKREHILDFEIELPPLGEQHHIVAKIEELFSELDKGIENLKTARAQLKVYRQALLKHAFEGKLTAEWREQNKDNLETAAALQQRIQTERAARYQQQVTNWQAAGQKGSKPKAPKPLPPLTCEELAELPVLPEGWAWVKYSELTECSQNGISKRSGDTGVNFTVLRLADITNQKISFEDVRQIMMSEKEIQNYKLLKNDLICIRVNGSVELVGRVISINDDLEAAYCDHFIRYKLLKNVVFNRYIEYFFNTVGVRRFIDLNKVSSAGQNTVNQEMIGAIAVSICSVGEQKIILEMIEEKFSEIDQLEQTITIALQQSDALRQSILKKAFSGALVAQDANDEPASVLLARIKAEKAAQVVTTKLRKPKKTQALPEQVKTNVIPFPVKIPNISATDLHAGIIARAYQLHENSKRLDYYGHVKAEKISHLVEGHLGIDLERVPFKDAAGPNDYPHLKKVESRARKAGGFDVRQAQKDSAYVLTRLRGFDALVDKTTAILGDRLSEVDTLLKLLLPMNTRQAEIVATLYAGWNNLLLLGQTPSDDEIVYESRENWHTDKLNIERDKFFKALVWMREHELVPMGKGRYVKNKE